MDLVITYLNQRYVIELKCWYGPKAHQEGYLLIYDFNKKKEYKQEQITVNEKQIFAVWV